MMPELDDGYAEAAADDRAEELAAYYEQAQAEVDAEARFLATEAEAGPNAPVPYTLTPRAEAYLLDSPEASNDEPEAGS